MEAIVITTLLGVIIALLGFIAKKLDKTLHEIQASSTLSHNRHDVTDVILSHVIKESFNSKSVAEGNSKWPNIFSSKQPRES